MLHPFSFFLSVLLTTCAMFGGFVATSFCLIASIVFNSPRSPVSVPFVVTVATVSAGQLIASITINVIANSNDSVRESVFGQNRDYVAMLGIIEASSERTNKFLASVIPSGVTLIYTLTMRKRLTMPVHVSPVNKIHSISLWCAASAATALVAPSAMAYSFFVLALAIGLLLTFGGEELSNGDERCWARQTLRVLALGSGIVGSLITGMICVAQNYGVSQQFLSGVDASVGLSRIFDLDATLAVRRGVQMLLMTFTVLLSHVLTEYRHIRHRGEHFPKRIDLGANSSKHNAVTVTEPLLADVTREAPPTDVPITRTRSRGSSLMSQTTTSGVSAVDVIGGLQRFMRRVGEIMLHYLVIVPFFPFLCIAAHIIAFPTLTSMMLLPSMCAGLLVSDIAKLKTLTTWTVALYGPWVLLQTGMLSFARTRQDSLLFRLMISQTTNGLLVAECSGTVLVYFVLLASLSQQRKFSSMCKPQAVHREPKSRTSFTGLESSSSLNCEEASESITLRAEASIGPERVEQLLSTLGVTCAEDHVDVVVTLTRLFGRPPTVAEADFLRASTVADLLESRIKNARKPAWRQSISAAWLIAQYYSTALSIFLVFIAGSCVQQLDVLHGIGLLIFLFYCAFPRVAKKRWSLIIAYIMFLTVTVNVITLVARFVTLPENLFPGCRWKTLGLAPLGNQWFAIPYFLVMIFVALERKIAAGMFQSWDDVITLYEWRQCFDLPLAVKWRQRFSLVLAVLVFVGLGLFEERCLLIEGFLGLFLLICVAEAYRARPSLLRFLWRGATVYAGCTIVAVCANQFLDVRDQLSSVISREKMLEIGIIGPGDQLLTFFLAPWFVALTVSIIHLSVLQREVCDDCTRLSEYSRPMLQDPAVVPATNFTADQLLDFASSDQKAFHVLQKFFALLETLAEFAAAAGADYGEWIVWIGLYAATTSEFTLMNAGYSIFLVLNMTNVPSLLYCVAHILVLYTYQFSFVPKISGTLNGVDLADLAGFSKTGSSYTASAVAGPTYVFFVILFRVCTKNCKLSWQIRDDAETLDTTSWRAFLLRQITANFGYELFLVFLVIGFSAAAHVASAVPMALLLAFAVRCGRSNFYESSWNRAVLYVGTSVVLLYELFCQIGASKHVFSIGTDTQWKYWGLLGRLSCLFSMFVCTCLLHATKEVRAAILDLQDTRQRYHHNTIIEYMLGNNSSDLKSCAVDRFEELVPKIPQSRRDSCRGQCMSALETLFAGASPTAFLSFAAGAQDGASLINVTLLIAGMFQFSRLEKIHWNFFRTWPNLLRAYFALICLPLIVNIPTVVDWSANHRQVASILGTAHVDGTPIGLSLTRLWLMVSVFIQNRLYEDFYFETILRQMFYDVTRRQEKHETLFRRVQELHSRDLQQAESYLRDLKDKLNMIRSAEILTAGGRNESTTSTAIKEEDHHSSPKKEDNSSRCGSPRRAPTAEEEKPSSPAPTIGIAAPFLSNQAELNPNEEQEEQEGNVTEDGGRVPFLQQIRKSVEAAVVVALDHLSLLTFDRQKVSAELYPSISSRFWRVILGCFERRTAEIALVASLVDFVQTGNLVDAVPVFLLLCILPSYSPFPPLSITNFLTKFVVVGIVIKAIVAVIITQVVLSVQLANFLSWTIIDLPVDPETGEPTTGTSGYRFLIYSFTVFASLIVHRHVCFANGVYAPNQHEDFYAEKAATGAGVEEDEPSTPSPMTPREDAFVAALPPRDETTTTTNERAATKVEDSSSSSPYRDFLLDFYHNCISVRGVGRDFYFAYSCVDAVALLVFVFGYYSISGFAHGSIVENVQSNLLPGGFVLLLMFSLLAILVDRMLYVARSMRGKLAFTLGSAVLYVIGFVWWSNTITPVSSAPGVAYFLVKCVYVYLSCLQVRYGLPLNRRHDPFTGHPEDIVRWLGYTIFRLIPFLYELRVTTDWTTEKTALTLPAYLHVEDLHDIVYNRYVMMDDAKERQPVLGTAIRNKVKLMDGGSRLLVMLVLLLFPLMFYSTFNPSLSDNSVTQLSMSLSFDSTVFFESNLLSIPTYPGDLALWLDRTRPRLGSFDTDSKKSVQLIDLSSCSADIWRISPQALRQLNDSLVQTSLNKTNMNINMKVTVSRPSATAGSSGTQELLNVWPVTWDTAASFANAIALVNKTNVTRLPNFYSPYIINQGPRVAFFNQIAGDPTLDTEDCSMEIRRERDDILGTDVWYWCLKCNSIFSSGQFPNNSAAYPEWPCLTRDQNCGDFNFEQYPTAYTPVPMYFVAYSDPVPTSISFLPNVGIIAIYTSFIIVIGRTFRGMFAGTTQNVIQTSMADPKPVSQLIEYIATARQCGDFKLEQSLYFELIDLLRSPERLLAVTGRNRRLYDDLGVAVTVHATSELVPAISESHDNNAETETV